MQQAYWLDRCKCCGCQEDDDLRRTWDVLRTPIYRVVDEHGANVASARVRRIEDELWLYVDEMDGFSVMTSGEVDTFGSERLVPEPETASGQ